MKTRSLLALALLCATSVQAKEVAGLKIPDATTVDGKELRLNGAGIRTKVIFKVYVAALYTEATSKDPQALLSSPGARRVELRMLRDLEKAKIVDAIREGFEKNSKADLPALKARLDQFVAAVPDLKEGQQLAFNYVPGKGTTFFVPGKELLIEGKDFSDALLRVWLGSEPVDGGLKKELLGG